MIKKTTLLIQFLLVYGFREQCGCKAEIWGNFHCIYHVFIIILSYIYYHFKSLRTCHMFVITHIFHVHVFIVMYRFSYALYAHMK